MKETVSLTVDAKTETAVFKRFVTHKAIFHYLSLVELERESKPNITPIQHKWLIYTFYIAIFQS